MQVPQTHAPSRQPADHTGASPPTLRRDAKWEDAGASGGRGGAISSQGGHDEGQGGDRSQQSEHAAELRRAAH
eukprot:2562479-Prymnesium_polylepis.2